MQKLLLLHGALGSSAGFDHLKAELAAAFECHSLDFKGHGGSEVPDALTIENFAEEVIAYLDANAIEKIFIFGYSMGGYVGLYLAANFPDRVEKLFTLATKIRWNPEIAAKETAFLDPEVVKEKIPKYAAALQNLHGEKWESLMEKTAAMMLELGKNPTISTEDFSKITMPLQIAVGDKDVMVTIEECLETYRTLSNGSFLVMPNTQHPIERVDTTELTHQIKKFFL